MKIDLTDKVIAVTGSGSGIGQATALAAAKAGARVAVLDVSEAGAASTVNQVLAIGGEALAVPLDVRDNPGVAEAVRSIESNFGPIFGLVTAAGFSSPAPAEAMDDNVWSALIDVNLSGVFRCIRECGKGMIARKSGSIVNISSVDGLAGHTARAHYVASKFGVIGLTKSLAVEWGRHGVRTNCVAPGVVDTRLLRGNVPPAHVEGVMIDRVPLGRLSSAEEQAAVCLFLLSDLASYVNGAVIVADGGLTAGMFTHNNGGDYASNRLLSEGFYSE